MYADDGEPDSASMIPSDAARTHQEAKAEREHAQRLAQLQQAQEATPSAESGLRRRTRPTSPADIEAMSHVAAGTGAGAGVGTIPSSAENAYVEHTTGIDAFYISCDQERQSSQTCMDMPPAVPGEDDSRPVFPEFLFDTGASAANIDQTQARQRKAYEERYNSLFRRALRQAEHWGWIPERLRTIGGSGEPLYIDYIRDTWRAFRKRAVWLSTVTWILWILFSWFMDSDSAVISDGSIVENLYQPTVVNVFDMTDKKFARWLVSSRTSMDPFDPTKGYNSVHVYDKGGERNVTTSWLTSALYTACKGDARVNPQTNTYDSEDECVCLPAVEIGIMTNVILIDGRIIYNARIVREMAQKVTVHHPDDSNEPLPGSISVVFENSNGNMERRFFDNAMGVCLYQSVRFVTPS